MKILNFKRVFCNNFILNFRFNDELSPLTTDQTGGYEHQNLPDENPRDDIGNAEEKRIRLVISNCFSKRPWRSPIKPLYIRMT